jgi:hypothetical protein
MFDHVLYRHGGKCRGSKRKLSWHEINNLSPPKDLKYDEIYI